MEAYYYIINANNTSPNIFFCKPKVRWSHTTGALPEDRSPLWKGRAVKRLVKTLRSPFLTCFPLLLAITPRSLDYRLQCLCNKSLKS